MNFRVSTKMAPSSAAVSGATRAAFCAIGFGMAVWAPLVPYAKSRLGADDAVLGLLLLCLGAGSLGTMPFAGGLAARFGCRAVILAASASLAAILPLLASVADLAGMAISLMLFGAAVGAADVAMNLQAVLVEQQQRRPMMSGFHAFYSLGGIAGAGSMSLGLWAGVRPLPAAGFAALLLILGLLPFARHMLPPSIIDDVADERGARLTRPSGFVLAIGALCCVAFLTEGAMLDWSGVFLVVWRHVAPAQAGAGFAVFSVAMTGGRLAGDALMRIGPQFVFTGGALCAALGLLLVVAVGATPVAFIGFAVVGLGLANLVPALYSALGRQSAIPANVAISTASTLGYAGILAGPVLIGCIAHLTTLPAAFLSLSVMLCAVALSARIVSKAAI